MLSVFGLVETDAEAHFPHRHICRKRIFERVGRSKKLLQKANVSVTNLTTRRTTMKISILAIAASSLAIGFMSETTDVVLATMKGSSGAVRVNKSDFDADQEKPEAERQYDEYKGKDEPEQSVAGVSAQAFDALDGVRPQSAPSAPNFTNGETVVKPVMDEQKGAVAPSVPSANSRLVMKDGSKFFVVDGMGAKLTAEAVGGDIDEDGYKSEKAAQDAIARLPR